MRNVITLLVVTIVFSACSSSNKEIVYWEYSGSTAEKTKSDESECENLAKKLLGGKKYVGRSTQPGALIYDSSSQYDNLENRKIVKSHCMKKKGYSERKINVEPNS